MILVQALDMTFANMARRYEWIVALMYVNCFLPLLIAGWAALENADVSQKAREGD